MADANKSRRACVHCRAARKQCKKERPCHRCVEKRLECVPYVPKGKPELEIPAASRAYQPVDEKVRKRKKTAPAPALSTGSPGVGEEDAFDTSNPTAPKKAKRHEAGEQGISLTKIVPVDMNFLVTEPPCFWDSSKALSQANGLSMNVSPMDIFDALHMPVQKLIFFFYSFCRVLPPTTALLFFQGLADVVSYSFPQMSLEARCAQNEKLRNLADECADLLRHETGLVLDSARFSVPATSTSAPQFSIEDAEDITKAVADFGASFHTKFPDEPFGLPAVVVNKISETGDLQCYINSRCEELYGFSMAEFNENLAMRERRDRQWYEENKFKSASGQLRSGLFW
eukprot:TRINITY_DN11848_c0_g1_i2.p1 TRINITY_DN11848_c0_g1~~TRINITY_DN11848_c0_g1_i2.p1  ORF type:complete len:399 (+),score=83.86 TRINITY_DN11848_c0_g1_i2:174-1199(+)